MPPVPSDVTTRIPFDLQLLRAERLECAVLDRPLIARHVLAFVALFAGDLDTAEAAMAGQVTCGPGEGPAFAAERQVRALAGAAESRTLQLTGAHPVTGDVLCAVLTDEFLLDDYLRIQAVEQHQAFGQPPTMAEIGARTEHLRAKADEARATAEFVARRRRDDLKLCRCGQNSGRHRRNAGRQAWQRADGGVCRAFADVDELPLGGLPHDLLADALRSWADRHDVVLTAARTIDGVRLLEEMRHADRSRNLRAAEAFAAAATALDWTTPAT